MSDLFSTHRPQLFGVAYRMLGSAAEAEDMVQETFLRWHAQPADSIREPRAWLVKTITRLCLDVMKSARHQREEYTGVWLPEPLVEEMAPAPDSMVELADTLGTAFMVMLEKLAPVDRAVFLLREAFGHDYAEISGIVGKSEAACRQIVSRAKASMGIPSPAPPPTTAEAERIVQEFMTACETGELEDLMALLTDDAILYSDGGGKVRAALWPIYTSNKISRMFLGLRARSIAGWSYRLAVVNGQVGVVIRRADGKVDVMTFSFEGHKLNALYMMRNPDKLRNVAF